MSPFDGKGGLAKMYQLFGSNMDNMFNELNQALAA
jgi:type I restriction enzyme R subunit